MKSLQSLCVLIILGCVSIVAQASDEPTTCKEINVFVVKNSDQLNSYETIMQSPYSDAIKRMAFSRMSSEAKAQFVKQHIIYLKTTLTLSREQTEFLAELYASITPNLFSGRNEQRRDRVHELETRGRLLFDKSSSLFALSSPTANNYSRDRSPLTADFLESPSAEKEEYSCNCSTDSVWNTCSGDYGNGHLRACNDGEDLCTTTDGGCGFIWWYPCNGECFGRYRDGSHNWYWAPVRKGRSGPQIPEQQHETPPW